MRASPRVLRIAGGLLASALLALTITLFVIRRSDRSSPPPRDQAQDDVREAVFRYQFTHNNWGVRGIGAIFLALDRNADPSDEFMRRFAGHTPPVKLFSNCSADPLQGVRDRATGKRGIMFSVNGLNWIDERTAEVKGSYYHSGRAASENIYTVKWKGGKWLVVHDQMIIIA